MNRSVMTAALLVAVSSSAMSVRTDASLVAWSTNGKSALLRIISHGPEGGGGRGYQVVGEVQARVEVSNTMSPGDGSTPERVTPASCKAAAKQLGAALVKAGISGATITESSCDDRSRSDVVTTEAMEETGFFAPGKGGVLTRGTARLEVKGAQLTVTEGDLAKTFTAPEAPPEGMRAALSPSGQLLLLFTEDGELFAALKPGKPAAGR
jgi:hypothetical protein